MSSLETIDPGLNEIGPNQGGFLGLAAILDAMNPWDLVKAFARGMRWMFVGRRHRKDDISYKANGNGLSLQDTAYKNSPNVDLPIADEFRRSKFGMPVEPDEGAGLIAHAQPNPLQTQGRPSNSSPRYQPARERFDPVTGQELSTGGTHYADDAGMAAGDIGYATSAPYGVQTYGGYPPPGRAEQSAAHEMLWAQRPGQGGYQPPYYGGRGHDTDGGRI